MNASARSADSLLRSARSGCSGIEEILKESGVPTLFGEKEFTTIERLWARPTAEVNGIGGGYQGKGIKTVIPSYAMAKLTFRLVPNQDPGRILPL
jgi:acetylornithine deacetylase/succinyl-diaminopimelate desuccinylase-like protein